MANTTESVPDELRRLRIENTILRVLAAKTQCLYGHRDASGVCSRGYPGCACADDLVALDAQQTSELQQLRVDEVQLRQSLKHARDLAGYVRKTAKDYVDVQGLTTAQRILPVTVALSIPPEWEPEGEVS